LKNDSGLEKEIQASTAESIEAINLPGFGWLSFGINYNVSSKLTLKCKKQFGFLRNDKQVPKCIIFTYTRKEALKFSNICLLFFTKNGITHKFQT